MPQGDRALCGGGVAVMRPVIRAGWPAALFLGKGPQKMNRVSTGSASRYPWPCAACLSQQAVGYPEDTPSDKIGNDQNSNGTSGYRWINKFHATLSIPLESAPD